MKTTTQQQQDRNDSSTGSAMFRRLGLWAAAGAAAVSISFGMTLEAVADNRDGDVHVGPARTEFTPIAPADAPRFTPIAPASPDHQHADRGAAHSDGNKGKRSSGARGGRG